MESEHLCIEWLLGRGKNKEIINLLEFHEKEYTAYPSLWDTMKEIQMENA